MNVTKYVFKSQNEAQLVLGRLADTLSRTGKVTKADVYKLIGFDISDEDKNWGWESVEGTTIADYNDGYLLELPPIKMLKEPE